MKFTPVAVAGLLALATGASAREMLGKADGEAVKYIDSAAIAAKGEADGAKYAALLGKKAAKEAAAGEAAATKYASKLAKGEAEKDKDCDKKAPGEAVSFTVTTTVTKEAKEGKKSKKADKGESDKGAGKFGEVVASKTAKEAAKAAAKGEADAINLANKNAAALAAANTRLANAGRRLAGCDKGGACPPPKTPEPVVYVVKSKVVKEAPKEAKSRSAKEIAKDKVIVEDSAKKVAMYKEEAKGIEAGVNATKKVWDAELKATQAELKNEVAAYKTTAKYAYESGKAASLTAAADARLAAAKAAGRRRLAGAETGVPSDAEFAARAGLAGAKVKHVKGDTTVAPAPRPAPTAAEKAKLDAYKAGTSVYVAKYAAEDARNKAIAAEMDAKRNATRAAHPKIEAKEKLAAAKHAEEMVAWKAKTGPLFAAKAAEEAENKLKYDFNTGELKTASISKKP